MPSNRRAFIRILGSSAVVFAAAGAGYALTRDPTAARAPWEQAGSGYADPRLNAVSYAILAPNPHNRQPWQIELIGDDTLRLYCDTDRLLPETDPFGRQIVIGLGCFLELLQIAAAADGYATNVTPFPEGAYTKRPDRRPVVEIVLSRSPETMPDPLFAHILNRRSNKEPFDLDKPVTQETLGQLLAVSTTGVDVAASIAPERVAALRDLTWDAHRVEALTPRTLQESIDLMRIGKAEINASPDGIDLGGAFLETLNRLSLLTREDMADVDSDAFAQGMTMYHELMYTAAGHVWLSTPGNSRVNQLNAGRAWVRINLQATKLGVDVHPISQALQEYPEMAELYQKLHQQLDVTAPRRLQMLARIGYGPTVPASPRWAAQTRLIGADART